MSDGGRVQQYYATHEETDGKNPQVERGILVTCRNFLRLEHVDEVWTRYGVYLAERCLDI
jgi:hypothetical protein